MALIQGQRGVMYRDAQKSDDGDLDKRIIYLNAWRRAWQPTPVFLLGEFHGQRNLVGYSPPGVAKTRTRLTNARTHTHTHTHTHTEKRVHFLRHQEEMADVSGLGPEA